MTNTPTTIVLDIGANLTGVGIVFALVIGWVAVCRMFSK